MALALLKEFNLTDNEKKYVNSLEGKFPIVKQLKEEIFGSGQDTINKLEEIYKKKGGNLNDIEAEQTNIIKLCYLYFGFKVVSVAAGKLQNKTKLIMGEYNNIVNQNRENLKKVEQSVGDKLDKEAVMKHMKMDFDKLLIESPLDFTKRRRDTVERFMINNLDAEFAFSDDIKKDVNGCFIIDAEVVKDIKDKNNLKKSCGPKLKPNEVVKISPKVN